MFDLALIIICPNSHVRLVEAALPMQGAFDSGRTSRTRIERSVAVCFHRAFDMTRSAVEGIIRVVCRANTVSMTVRHSTQHSIKYVPSMV